MSVRRDGNAVFIRPIDKDTVHQICSGQVILSLATAVKELIENSIDAGATNIQIKLEEYGSEMIEVIDNGCGVEEVNFQALTLKHHTSKISAFDDLYTVETFGFRGEALSSLCALSDVTITTCHKNAVIGTNLKFNHQGTLIHSSKTLRKCGTTVRLENLFYTLPVRRTEFLKNLKKEFSKMCNVIYAYGLQSEGIRITCTNHVSKAKSKEIKEEVSKKKGTTTVIMDTKGESLESNITSIFGVKQKQSLLRIKEKLPSDVTLKEFGLENKKIDFEKFKIEGFISSCAHGSGRSASDKQFYYINSRPIDYPKISKLVNEVYHQFNARQDPFAVVNIKLAHGLFDINMTPDKRQVLIQNEKILLAILKESLLNIFQGVPSMLDVQNVGLQNKLHFESVKCLREEMSPKSAIETKSFFERWRKKDPDVEMISRRSQSKLQQSSLKNYVNSNCEPTTSLKNLEAENFHNLTKTESENRVEELHAGPASDYYPRGEIGMHHFEPQNIDLTENVPDHSDEMTARAVKVEIVEPSLPSTNRNYAKESDNGEFKRKLREASSESRTRERFALNDEFPVEETDSKKMKFDEGLTEECKRSKKSITVNIELADLLKMMADEKRMREKNQEKDGRPHRVEFLAEIKPENNERAETELKRVMRKESFAQMTVIGQFNLGFILTELNSDVFIIDQHASDEKYNYERVRADTVLRTQTMVNPEILELTADKEELMLQHRNVFVKNGFSFTFDETAAATRRIKLTGIPLSKNVIFGKEDIDELLFLLEDAPEKTMLRPSRMERMFASRACRKSVMIGTPLNRGKMRKIVDHMGELEQPWNCPHGRPTIRHLVNLHMISLQK